MIEVIATLIFSLWVISISDKRFSSFLLLFIKNKVDNIIA